MSRWKLDRDIGEQKISWKLVYRRRQNKMGFLNSRAARLFGSEQVSNPLNSGSPDYQRNSVTRFSCCWTSLQCILFMLLSMSNCSHYKVKLLQKQHYVLRKNRPLTICDFVQWQMVLRGIVYFLCKQVFLFSQLVRLLYFNK